MSKYTVTEDLEEILGYMIADEEEDFVEHFQRGDSDVALNAEEMEHLVERVRHEGNEPFHEIAKERSNHVFGRILRVGQQLLGWED